jgi:peptide/nickel transport system substrate-binding protein
MASSREDDRSALDRLTRRRFLIVGSQGAAALGGAGFLAACGGAKEKAKTGTGPSGTPAAGNDKPVQGGTFTIGMVTAGVAETMNPAKSVNLSDLLRIAQLYDQLFTVGPDVKTLVPRLALSAEPNKDATVWTIRLRDGVKWHDGKPFTADDVVYTLNLWADPTSNAHGQVAHLVDFKKVRKRDPLTVEIPLLRPTGQFPSVLTFNQQVILQNGATKQQINTRPIGTGPFKFESFTPGQQSVFVANRDYWETGKPHVDKLVVNSSFSDEKSRQNALLSGAINISPFLPPLVAKQLASARQATLLKSHSVVQYWFLMRVDQGPFADPRVRQAMKLIADRKALIDGALAGYGTPANDLIGVGTEYYASDLPQREQDIEQAKSLLKAAGQEGFSFVLPTADALPGFNPSATLFAQQAAKAGVKVKVQQVSPNTYYTPAGGFLKRPIGLDLGAPFQSLTEVYRTFFTSSAPFNETFWGKQKNGAAAAKLIDDAIAATDAGKAAQLWAEVQRQQYDEGGVLGWANADDLVAVGPSVRGITVAEEGYMNYFRLADGWIAS